MAVLLAAVAGLAPGRAASAPSFNADVAPILAAKCVSCHRKGQLAPMSLVRFDEARPWAQAIKKKVAAREMPPWLADSRFGRFKNDPSLTPAEIATIVGWVDGGAREGSGASAAAPAFAEGWTHPSGRPPDIVLEMPIAFDVPAEGILPPFAIYSQLPPELTSADHFVEAVQLLPSNPATVHHSAFSMRALPAGVTLGAGAVWPGGPVLGHVALLVDRGPNGLAPRRLPSAAELFSTVGASHFVFYFPGNSGFAEFPAGSGKRIRREDFAEWSVHYTTSGQPARDRERVGLWLQHEPPTHEVLTMRIGDFHIVNGQEVVLPAGVSTSPGHAAIVNVPTTCDGVPCAEDRSMIPAIPPRADNWRITGITPLQDDMTLYLAYPHGHLRLKDMTYVVTYPDGREETILSVPRFDFNWQLIYEWAAPLHIPAGSTIKAIGHYDNSRRNRSNPAPDEEVRWGEQTTDEMFNGYLDLSIDKLDVRLEREVTGNRPGLTVPRVPVVTVVGCVSRGDGSHPLLTHASAPSASEFGHADEGEIAAARSVPLGTKQYELIGAADWSTPEELLTHGQRALFTTAATANATGILRDGRRVAVKALLIADGSTPRLNLLSMQPVADSCR